MHATSQGHFLGICGYCWFQQDGQGQRLAGAKGWFKSRFGGKSSASWPSTRGRPGVRTCPPPPPDFWFWSVAIDRTQKTTLVELKETMKSFAQSMDEEVKRRCGVSADELAPAWSVTMPRLRRDSSGPDSMLLCRPLTVICVLKLKHWGRSQVFLMIDLRPINLAYVQIRTQTFSANNSAAN